MSTIKRAYRGGRTFLNAVRALGITQTPTAWRFALGLPFPVGSDHEHLAATVAWLCAAQDNGGGEGVSAVYYLRSGWDAPYPETSGYILATFLACGDYFNDPELADRARRIGNWEISIQAPSGGIYSRPGFAQTRVFNTGQVILGWCALFERTGDQRYLDAAKRAGEYLARIQDVDGSWKIDTHCGARTYHARTDWGLLRLAKLSGESRYAEIACKNLRWVMQQQQENGWFRNCGFNNDDPITHVIDYTLIGVLESSLLEPGIFDCKPTELIGRCAEAVCDIVENSYLGGIRGMIPASFDANWCSRDNYSCLTGNAQLAYTLLRLYGLTGIRRYATCADSLISALKRTQALNGTPIVVRGAVPGSFPMCHGYLANGFPNWSAKFFADALLASLKRDEGFHITA